MTTATRFLIFAGAALGALALAATYAQTEKPTSIPDSPVVLTASETLSVNEFETRLVDYLALQRKLVASLPTLPTQATPEQVDQNQQDLGALIKTARADAKTGDFFTPGMQAMVRRALASVIAGPDGETIKASIMDENPGVPNLSVNDRYPDSIPLSTMPVEVLEALPKLGDGLECRFIGKRLILMDTRAQIIIDFTEDVLP